MFNKMKKLYMFEILFGFMYILRLLLVLQFVMNLDLLYYCPPLVSVLGPALQISSPHYLQISFH
jgi:hypothetical protein